MASPPTASFALLDALDATSHVSARTTQEHNVAKVEEHTKELFDKTEKNEKGLADSLQILERKVRVHVCA